MTIQDVLASTNNGIDLYQKYGSFKQKGRNLLGLCPFHSERTPSFNIMPTGIYKCFGCGKSGNIFTFLKEINNWSFLECMENLQKELSIPNSFVKRPVILKRPEFVYDFDIQPYTKLHKAYFNQYELPERYLVSKNIFAIKTLSINKRIFEIPEGCYAFAYDAGGDKCKILLLGENAPWKWRNSTAMNGDYLWYFDENKEYDELWPVKSNKDACCLEYHFGKTTIAAQNEEAVTLLEYNYEKINKAKRVIVHWGSDFMAYHERLLLSFYTNWEYFEIPHYLEERYELTDVSDCIKEFGVEYIETLINQNYGRKT